MVSQLVNEELSSGTVVRVSVPERSLRHDLRGVKILVQRELIRFWWDRTRLVTSLVQPLLWLLVLGTGLSALVARGSGGLNLRTFIFPGVVAMSTMFTALFSAASIVWDREFGFLREMLVAPISRATIVVGKTLGGALIATLQGLVILGLAGLAGVPYSPMLLLTLAGEMFLAAFMLTAFGVVLAARIKSIQAFMGVMQIAMMPMMFLSGALFPLANLPTWLAVLTRVNPMTYAVDPMRHAVFGHLAVSPAVHEALGRGVTWNGWAVPASLEVLIVAMLGLAMLGVAILEFRRTE
ncbi:MAG TPA: ABC transporter permease [Mycobacteriales bacterium]|nr:ABC transporter permease [Mycobacteriales bacterium]